MTIMSAHVQSVH